MPMRSRRHWGRLPSIASGIAATALVAGACSGGDGTRAPGSSPGSARAGGVATFALPPGTVPDWIFPFIDSAHSSVVNSSLSPPVFSNGNKTVTLSLKSYRWSDGEAVTTTDIAFWLNLLAAEKQNWAYYVPGGLPDNLTGYKIVSPTTIVLSLKSAYSPDWFTDNELSQITPLPAAWNKTSATTAGHCATSADLGLAYIVISHDLSVVRYLADRIGVMYLGKLVELGPSGAI
jgi:peptide/nickel transport system substrate-binding protein